MYSQTLNAIAIGINIIRRIRHVKRVDQGSTDTVNGCLCVVCTSNKFDCIRNGEILVAYFIKQVDARGYSQIVTRRPEQLDLMRFTLCVCYNNCSGFGVLGIAETTLNVEGVNKVISAKNVFERQIIIDVPVNLILTGTMLK